MCGSAQGMAWEIHVGISPHENETLRMKVNNHACILAGITCYASASLKIIMQASLHQIFKLVSLISYYMKV